MTKLPSTLIKSLRRKGLAFGAAFVTLLCLTACSSVYVGGGDIGQIYLLAKMAWNGNNQKVTLAQAAAVPYASLGVRMGDGPQFMLVLAKGAGRQRLWTSASHIALTTRNGRLVRTAGLPHNLSGYQFARVKSGKNGARTISWLADFADLGLYSIPITCHDFDAGADTIVILGKDIQTQRVNENCTSQTPRLDWSFHNTYWVDPKNGLTWRSVQHIHPNAPPIETEILRPPE